MAVDTRTHATDSGTLSVGQCQDPGAHSLPLVPVCVGALRPDARGKETLAQG